MARAMYIDISDNVATCIEDIAKDDVVICFGGGGDQKVVAREAIASGHKIALRPITANSAVTKYGEAIGKATVDIRPGEWVHHHNCAEIYVASREGSLS